MTRERILEAAVALADAQGLAALSMRRIGQELGVEAMSLYNHVANKEAILDGMTDRAMAEVELPRAGEDWKEALRRRSRSVLEMLRRHPWALPLLDSRQNPGTATLRHHDAVIGCLRGAGFSLARTAMAFSLLDSYVHGFAMQQARLPFENGVDLAELADGILRELPRDEFPHFVELTTQHVLQPGYDFGREFSQGLDLILDALERELESPGAP